MFKFEAADNIGYPAHAAINGHGELTGVLGIIKGDHPAALGIWAFDFYIQLSGRCASAGYGETVYLSIDA